MDPSSEVDHPDFTSLSWSPRAAFLSRVKEKIFQVVRNFLCVAQVAVIKAAFRLGHDSVL
jgi:hypothetical protein